MKKTIVAIASALTFASGAAQAGMITEWTYDNQAGFIFAQPDAVIESGFQAADVLSIDTHKKLEWGDALSADGRSSLVVDSPVVGTLTTVDGLDALEESDFAQGTNMTHNNFRIGGAQSNWLTSAVLLDGLRLGVSAWDLPFPTGALTLDESIEIGFGFQFIETPNRPDSGICVDGKAAGTDFDNVDPNEGAGCDDYFILQPNDDVAFTIDVISEAIEFKVTFDLIDYGFDAAIAELYDFDTRYTVTTRLSGLTPVTDFCGDQAVPCVGFATKELESNTLVAKFAIQAVPEPASIALFGLGLIGLGAAARKKRKA